MRNTQSVGCRGSVLLSVGMLLAWGGVGAWAHPIETAPSLAELAAHAAEHAAEHAAQNGAPNSAAVTAPHKDDRTDVHHEFPWIEGVTAAFAEPARTGGKPTQALAFEAFAPAVKVRWDERYLYIESDGLPRHGMMVGIRSWQQQVPLPQAFTGDNAFRLPLVPQLSATPISGRKQLYRGAIAVAVNGIPIFNALNNRGEDALLAGELDEWGGHCGRADDYHYHVAPLHLLKSLPKGSPLGYAMDGFPIYAPLTKETPCPDGCDLPLDDLNGHLKPGGTYHYHATEKFPYVNGGLRGVVTVQNDGVEPQPKTPPVRQAQRPLRGAVITGFQETGERAWSLKYTLGGGTYTVNYRVDSRGRVSFEFVDPTGKSTTETYTRREGRGPGGGGGGNGGGPGGGDRPPPPPADGPRGEGPGADGPGREPPPGDGPRGGGRAAIVIRPNVNAAGFEVSSGGVGKDHKLPAEFTCDGASVSPPLEWKGAPAGTVAYAITMHHIPGPPRPGERDGTHVYWMVYDLPAEVTSLAKADAKTGTRGVNTVNRRREYAPPCSKGPGDKLYTITVYALSAPTGLAPGATLDELLAAVKDKTLGTTVLDVTYARSGR